MRDHYRTFPDYSSPPPPPEDASNGRVPGGVGGKKSFALSQEAMDTWEKNRNIYANRYRDTSKRFRGVWNLMMLWKGSVMKLASTVHTTVLHTVHILYM